MEEVVESAARHMGFSDHGALASSNDLPGMENVVPHCGQECAHHAALMNPTIWSGRLPVDLLQRVFARLPLAGIIRLRCLSREWNKILNSHYFKQVCEDAHPKLFATIYPFCYSGRFAVRLYDLRSNTWHKMEIDTGYREPFHTMNATDGGLVCFACTSAKEESIQVPVLVCNPLTRAVRALPLHSHNKRPPKILQLVMDRITKCYKVLIFCSDANGGLVAEVFHSDTGAWTATDLSNYKYFWGYGYSWSRYYVYNRYNASAIMAPCVYDCAEGRFLDIRVVGELLSRDGHNFDVFWEQWALVQDRLFVLHKKEREAIQGGGFSEQGYYIAEYQAVKSGENWLKLRDHRCSNFEYPALGTSDSPILHACKGFVLVSDVDSPDEPNLERLYDLATGKWHALSPEFLKQINELNMMCELQWDAIP